MRPSTSQNSVVRFGVFEADLGARELRKNGVKVKIQELPFRALELLLNRPNEVLTREEFRQALWPDGVFVDFDHGISSAINRLRDTLGDSAENPIFIQTVDRRGYRWVAPVHTPAPLAPAVETEAVGAKEIETSGLSEPHSPRWRWIFVLPVLAVLFAAWSFRPSYRSAKAGATAPPSAAPSLTTALQRHAANREAEDLYLKGRYYWNKRTPEDLNKALDYFTQSVVRDPSYAEAYVGLADCYILMREYTLMAPAEAYPRALAAARKAVELDEHSSEAHASVAFASFYGMWDAATAEREFRRAIALNPANAVAHHWYANCLSALRRHPEAIAEIERAQAIDSSSASILADKGVIFFEAGRHDQAIALLKQMEATEPGFVSPHRYLKYIYFAGGDYPNYLVELRKEALLLHDDSTLALAHAAEKGFAAGRDRGMLESMLPLQKKLYERGHASPYFLAQTSTRLGNRGEAIQYLRAALGLHDEQLVVLEADPVFKPLHDDPGYRDLVARIGFPAQKQP